MNEETIKTRIVAKGQTSKQIWIEGIADWLLDASKAILDFEGQGAIHLQYEFRKATPDHPMDRFLFTGDVAPRIQINKVMEKAGK